MKKFTVILVSMVLCLGAVGLLVGCGGGTDYDDSALLARLDQLEQDNADLQGQLDSLLNTEARIYELGETFTYSFGGMDWFSIKVEINPDNLPNFRMTLTNLNMPNLPMNEYVANRYRTAENSWGSGFLLTESRLGINQTHTSSVPRTTGVFKLHTTISTHPTESPTLYLK
ncbi:MAG: hypothetical protein FWH03_06595 [Firmicutes bacterium]|nr:hypothetical protein [Bacillota bacterium]